MTHWTEQDFEHWLYGLREEDEHLRDCAACRAEASRMMDIRRQSVAEQDVPAELLAAQRRAIYQRLDQPVRVWLRARVIAPVGAGLAVAVLAFTILMPSTKPNQPLFSHADEQFFSELSSMDQSAEPKAIQPIHGLFGDN